MTDRTVLPIAVGFYLLALPLLVAIFLAATDVGRWSNAAGAGLMILCGVAVQRRTPA